VDGVLGFVRTVEVPQLPLVAGPERLGVSPSAARTVATAGGVMSCQVPVTPSVQEAAIDGAGRASSGTVTAASRLMPPSPCAASVRGPASAGCARPVPPDATSADRPASDALCADAPPHPTEMSARSRDRRDSLGHGGSSAEGVAGLAPADRPGDSSRPAHARDNREFALPTRLSLLRLAPSRSFGTGEGGTGRRGGSGIDFRFSAPLAPLHRLASGGLQFSHCPDCSVLRHSHTGPPMPVVALHPQTAPTY